MYTDARVAEAGTHRHLDRRLHGVTVHDRLRSRVHGYIDFDWQEISSRGERSQEIGGYCKIASPGAAGPCPSRPCYHSSIWQS